MKFVIGTRGSQLSLAQTNWIVSQLENTTPDHQYEVKTIKTKGDTDARPLFFINQKGIFEKEIDRAVLEKKVDFAVHSMKDVPSELPDGLTLACIPKRESSKDVFISKDNSTIDNIKSGALVGTSSLRRAVQLQIIRPDLKVKPVRGNIETRIKKATDGDYDAVVLAQAGISRLGISVNYSVLDQSRFSPSPGQGALAVVCREGDTDTISMLKKIEDCDSRISIEAERALSIVVDSGCRFPVGAFAQIKDDKVNLNAIAFSVDGKESITVQKDRDKTQPQELGRQVGEELRKQGVERLAQNWREKVDEWNEK